MESIEIAKMSPGDEAELNRLIAHFRVSLARLRGENQSLDLDSAREELQEYQQKGYPIFLAKAVDTGVVGYLVCRVDGDVVWAESLYVLPSHRRQGVGTQLYIQAEKLAEELGCGAPYNWVDPDNARIIHFLRKRGYNVLNLIELRRPRQGENDLHEVVVGSQVFKHGGGCDQV